MGLTERQKQVFIHGTNGQIENAFLEHYEKALNAKTLQGEMYWWSAVFHANEQRGSWEQTNLAANLVREMIMNERNRNNVMLYDRIDDIAYGVDTDTENEIRHAEKNQDGETTMVVQNEDPQMHEFQSNTLVGFLLMLSDLVEICDEPELRALAYFLYKTGLDKFLDYLVHEEFDQLKEILQELYQTVEKSGTIDKIAFIAKTRWFSRKSEESLREKLISILP